MCLQKAPEDRPSASKLLEHKFFKTTHDQSTVRRHLLDGLPTLPDRVKALRTGSAPSAHNCEQSRAQAAESRNQYVAGVSAWNFDLAEIKRQARAFVSCRKITFFFAYVRAWSVRLFASPLLNLLLLTCIITKDGAP